MRIPCSAAGSAQGEILGWGDPSPPNILIYQILKCLSNWSIAEYQISKVLLVYIRKQMTYSASLKLKGLMTRHWFQRISTRKAQDHCQPGVLCLYLFCLYIHCTEFSEIVGQEKQDQPLAVQRTRLCHFCALPAS